MSKTVSKTVSKMSRTVSKTANKGKPAPAFVITRKFLQLRGACDTDTKKFLKLWPSGYAEVTLENCQAAARAHISLKWLAARTLNPEGYLLWGEEQRALDKQHNDRYQAMTKDSLEAYGGTLLGMLHNSGLSTRDGRIVFPKDAGRFASQAAIQYKRVCDIERAHQRKEASLAEVYYNNRGALYFRLFGEYRARNV